MPFDPSKSEPVADAPTEFSPEKSKPVSDDKRETFDVGQMLKESGIGTAVGAVTPEILSYGVAPAMAAFPLTAPAAPLVEAAGQSMRGARLAGAASGAVGGFTGELGGQIVEKNYGPGIGAEAARVLGSTIGPEPFYQLGSQGGKVLSSLFGGFIPGARTAKTLGQLMQEGGIDSANLTKDQVVFLQKKLNDIRGGQSSLEAQKEIAQYLKTGAQNISQKAEQQASTLENQANQLIEQTKSIGGKVTAETEQKINRLQSQLNSAAEKIRQDADQQAKKLIEQGRQQAERIRVNSAGQSENVRQIAEIDAKDAIQKAQQQADLLTKQAVNQEQRLRGYRDKVLNITGRYEKQASRQVQDVGQAVLPTPRGQQIRKAFVDKLDELKAAREKVVEDTKKPVFDAAINREMLGETYKNTKAYKRAINKIDEEMSSRETGLSNLPTGEIRSSIQKVKDALERGIVTRSDGVIEETPLSFQALDILRRNLRDRGSGLPAEGYDAIGQQQANRLATYVEDIMEDFSPGFRAYKDAYREASVPINEFQTTLGKAVTGKPEGFDIGQYIKDPSTLGNAAFKSKGSVDQLISILGHDQAEQIARGFVADELRDANSQTVKNFIKTHRDWLPSFSNLENQLNQVERNLAQSEKITNKGKTLEKSLNTKIESIPSGLLTQARRVETEGAKAGETLQQKAAREAARLETTGGREAEKVETAGMSEADKLKAQAEQQISQSAKAVERQTGKVETEAQKTIKELTAPLETEAGKLTTEAGEVRKRAAETAKLLTAGDTTGPQRVKDLIFSKNEKELAETAKIILSNPKGKEKFGEAVGQVIADRASSSLKGAINDWKYISDNLVTNGLMDKKMADSVAAKLQDVFVAPISDIKKSKLAHRLIRNAVVGVEVAL